MNFNLRASAVAVAGALLMATATTAMADSTLDIVNALVTKGVLTEEKGALLTKGRNNEADFQKKERKQKLD
jgi:predicted lipoprotein with Yx(FWY)xxD motif